MQELDYLSLHTARKQWIPPLLLRYLVFLLLQVCAADDVDNIPPSNARDTTKTGQIMERRHIKIRIMQGVDAGKVISI